MTSRLQKIEANTDTQILCAMIQSKEFLTRLLVLPIAPFDSPWANRISKWCLDFLREFQEAPGKEIRGIFDKWARKTQDEPSIMLIEKVLQNLSDSAEPITNINYLVDLAEKRFNEVQLKRLSDKIAESVEDGETATGLDLVTTFKRITISESYGRNPFSDSNAIQQAFEMPPTNLFNFPGKDIGEFFEDQLGKECFVTIQAPEKRGKSWWILEMLFRALRGGCRVAMFEAGDMTERQVIHRLASRIAGKPIRKRYCGTFEVPVSIDWETLIDDKGKPVRTMSVGKRLRTVEEPMEWGEAFRTGQRFMKNYAADGGNLIMSCHPNSTLTLSRIRSLLDTWARERKFEPDVILIDYADLLMPESTYKDYRQQVNEIWKGLRMISQERKCLLLTASQGSKGSYTEALQNMSHVTEDKRKNAHVTGTFGLNQVENDQKEGIMRLNWTVLREGDYTSSRTLYVAGCLRIGRPCIASTW